MSEETKEKASVGNILVGLFIIACAFVLLPLFGIFVVRLCVLFWNWSASW